ncbi:MAG TPA: archaemetzincin family Zn-dependent metalloprotease [Bryobacteraceae bacterium]|nr:archaemetzincin family Zn-dependent metalloprotease [Bryobacteraceae bacterium]
MNGICLIEIGPVGPAVTAAVAEHIRSTLETPTRMLPQLEVPASAWDPKRRQYAAVEMLRALAAVCPPQARRLLALTECDLYIPVLSFVFGQAQLDGRLAVVSLARLRQEFYGLAPHQAMLISRALTEAIHELGHTFGLVHCIDPGCAMSLAVDVRHVDRKKDLCRGCLETLRAKTTAATSGIVEEKEP